MGHERAWGRRRRSAGNKRLRKSTAKSSASPSTLLPLDALPPEVLRDVLLCLPLSSRAALRRCSRSLSRIVTEFDRNIILGRDGSAAYGACRRELVHCVENKRWLSRAEEKVEGRSVPGPCHLRRLASGDHTHEPDPNFYRLPSEYYKRRCRYYDDAKLVDDRLWVLYNSTAYMFEVFDIDTGRGGPGSEEFCPVGTPAGLECAGRGLRGPCKYYVSDAKEDLALFLMAFDGRHGMLAAGMIMHGTENPYGAWSGPYLTVWEIATNEIVMSVDLYKPLSRVVDVNVVSKDKVAVLLKGQDGVELQWHKIPQKADWHSEGKKPPTPCPPQPGAEPPPHECTDACPLWGKCLEKERAEIWRGEKEFWEEQRRARGREKDEGCESGERKASYEKRCAYNWWPRQSTMLQRHVLRSERLEGINDATMASDGKGMLVVAVADEVQVWHVGSMKLMRECHPFGGLDGWNYHSGIRTQSIGMHTVVHPFEDVLGPGEGSYYSTNRGREVPSLRPSREVQGSRNPLDLASCDSLTLLARFTHLTFDEQRAFERDHSLASGACSPQLNCVVRVALAFCDEEREHQIYIVQMDIDIFHHIRHRESSIVNFYSDESIEEDLEKYEELCNGKCWWVDSHTVYGPHAETGCQNLCGMKWSRGGLFDFEGGPSCIERTRTLGTALARVMEEGDILTNRPELLQSCRDIADIQEQILRQRRITCLSIDTAKIVICTGYEVTILPFALELPGMEGDQAIPEEWRESWNDPDSDSDSDSHGGYDLDSDTKTWHSFRPLDDMLIDCWHDIRLHAEYVRRREEGREFSLTSQYDADESIDAHTITANLGESLKMEKTLMREAAFLMPRMTEACLSWRYFSVICDDTSRLKDPTSFDGNWYDRLHVFDVLDEWTNSSCEQADRNVGEEGVYLDTDGDESSEDSQGDLSDGNSMA